MSCSKDPWRCPGSRRSRPCAGPRHWLNRGCLVRTITCWRETSQSSQPYKRVEGHDLLPPVQKTRPTTSLEKSTMINDSSLQDIPLKRLDSTPVCDTSPLHTPLWPRSLLLYLYARTGPRRSRSKTRSFIARKPLMLSWYESR